VRASRHELGQWFTPTDVVDLALALALGQKRGAHVLDPACGDGAFLTRLETRAGCRATGIEFDPAVARAARARVPRATIRHGNFFATDFAERFDAVVGNPPYVRHERLSRALKQSVLDALFSAYPALGRSAIESLIARGDFAIGFLLRSLALLKPSGRAVFVVSSALLDARYAQAFWQVLGLVGRVTYIIDAPEERWFADAAVNALLVVLEPVSARPDDRVTLARLTRSTREARERVRSLDDLAKVAELRTAPALDPKSWPGMLRSSSAWFHFKSQAGARLVPLSELASVERGTTSGANEIFYVSRQRARELAIESSVLKPLLRSPRDLGEKSLRFDANKTPTLAVVMPARAGSLKQFPAAARYLLSHADACHRPTLQARPLWWALPAKPARLFLTKSYASRFIQPFTSKDVVADQRLYVVRPRAVSAASLAAVLNSTFTAFALESLGRASLGEGALEWTVADVHELPVLDPRGLSQKSLAGALQSLARRAIEPVWSEARAADRRALDRLLGGRALAPHLPAIHDALIESVMRRNRRATSIATEIV
jgi:predicted RNA methylase